MRICIYTNVVIKRSSFFERGILKMRGLRSEGFLATGGFHSVVAKITMESILVCAYMRIY
jgi:hypothetical protein